jgi:CheY-like chemotaxis protein
MSVMDAFAATQCIRKTERLSGSHTPIIASTANVTEGDQRNFLEAGRHGFLGKPIHRRELETIIAEYLWVEGSGGRSGRRE